jgi:hypothetical protein
METSLVTVGRLSAVIGLTLGGKKVTLFLVDEGTKRVSFTSKFKVCKFKSSRAWWAGVLKVQVESSREYA